MSPASTATREKSGDRTGVLLPYASLERLLGPPMEIVVDWQMQSDSERKG